MKDNTLNTKRLEFKILEKDDVFYLESLEKDPEVRYFFPTGAHKSREETEAMINDLLSDYEEHALPCFLI